MKHSPFLPSAKQDIFYPDQLIAGNFQPVTKTAIITGGNYQRGTILGTADGIKYTACLKTATDGSELPAAILVDDVDASTVDKDGGLYLTGEYNINAVTIDASWTTAEITHACEKSNIYLRNPVAAQD